jgi:hypothetical protein
MTYIKSVKSDLKKTMNVFLIFVFLIIVSMTAFAGTCNTNQPIGSPCFDNVRILKECGYVDLYKDGYFYGQELLTFTNGFYYYDYSLNIKDEGSYILQFCDGQTWSLINMYYPNATMFDIANITVIYPVKDSSLNTNIIHFSYNISPDIINDSNYLYSEVFLFSKGTLLGTAINNVSVNQTLNYIISDSGTYQFYIKVFYIGGNITSDTQSFSTSFTSDTDAWTQINSLSSSEVMMAFILFFAYIGILFIGLYFKNPAFSILGFIMGFLFGIFMLKVNMLFGIAFMLSNLVAMLISFFNK